MLNFSINALLSLNASMYSIAFDVFAPITLDFATTWSKKKTSILDQLSKDVTFDYLEQVSSFFPLFQITLHCCKIKPWRRWKKSSRISHPSNHQFFIRNFFGSVLLPYEMNMRRRSKWRIFTWKTCTWTHIIIRVVHIFNEITVTIWKSLVLEIREREFHRLTVLVMTNLRS